MSPYPAFTVVTNNIPERAPRAKVRAHIQGRFLNPSPSAPPMSVAGLQEIREWHDELRLWLPKQYRVAHEFIGQGFVWDSTKWKLLDIDSFISTRPTDVGEKGAGPDMMGQKRVQWLHLRQRLPHGKLGPHLMFYNLHAVPSIHVPKQRDGDRSRDSLHEEHMREQAAHVANQPFPTILVGDFNAEWKHSNLNPLRNRAKMQLVNPISGPNRATHGKRQIDLILRRHGKGRRYDLKRIDVGLLPKVLRDDHAGVWAQMQFAAP